MSTHGPMLIAVDVGNINTKFRRQAGAWEVEPAIVRLMSARKGYSFGAEEVSLKPFIYHDGPAPIERNVPYLIGHDAERAGTTDVARIGSAELRVNAPAYTMLHLYGIIASLPLGVTSAEIVFAGGLPVEDDGSGYVRETLRHHLTGKRTKADESVAHLLRWGDTEYTITITKTSFVPQPIGAIATLLFGSDGRVQANGALLRQRYALDIGGGTTDFTGRKGLDLIAGTEGGVRIGVHDAAETARVLVQRRFPRLRHLDTTQILQMLRQNTFTLHVGGEPYDVSEEIGVALHDTADAILAQVLPVWERTFAQGEVLLFGGGGALMSTPIHDALKHITTVTLLPNPLFRVADGIERLARHHLKAA